MGLSRGPQWEVQWHPPGGQRVRRVTLSRKGLRNLLIVVALGALLVLAVMGIIPIGLQGLFQQFTVDASRRENRALRTEGERFREEALRLSRRLNLLLQRGARLAWAAAPRSRAWDRPPPAPLAGDAADETIAASLSAAIAQIEALGEALSTAGGAAPCPLAALPTAAPLNLARAVPIAPFGWHTSPFTGREEAHYGTTLAAALGEPVLAPGAARVVFAGSVRERRANEWSLYGTIVVLDHGGGVFTVLGHLRDAIVRRGQSVTRGQRLGSVGQTGWTRVPALYFEIRWPLGGGNPPIDPALVAIALPIADAAAAFARPAGDLPPGFALLDHLPRR